MRGVLKVILAALAVVMLACGSLAVPVPTAMAVPTSEPVMIQVNATSEPTPTITATPTQTPTPPTTPPGTATPGPTATPDPYAVEVLEYAAEYHRLSDQVDVLFFTLVALRYDNDRLGWNNDITEIELKAREAIETWRPASAPEGFDVHFQQMSKYLQLFLDDVHLTMDYGAAPDNDHTRRTAILDDVLVVGEQLNETARGISKSFAEGEKFATERLRVVNLATPTPTPGPVKGEYADIVAIDTQVTESNDKWWRYTWKATVQNDLPKPIVFNLVVQWLDREGFVIEDNHENDLVLVGNTTKTFNGFQLIDVPRAKDVASIRASGRIR